MTAASMKGEYPDKVVCHSSMIASVEVTGAK